MIMFRMRYIVVLIDVIIRILMSCEVVSRKIMLRCLVWVRGKLGEGLFMVVKGVLVRFWLFWGIIVVE